MVALSRPLQRWVWRKTEMHACIVDSGSYLVHMRALLQEVQQGQQQLNPLAAPAPGQTAPRGSAEDLLSPPGRLAIPAREQRPTVLVQPRLAPGGNAARVVSPPDALMRTAQDFCRERLHAPEAARDAHEGSEGRPGGTLLSLLTCMCNHFVACTVLLVVKLVERLVTVVSSGCTHEITRDSCKEVETWPLADAAGGKARAGSAERESDEEDADMSDADAADAPPQDSADDVEEPEQQEEAAGEEPDLACQEGERAGWRVLLGGGDETRHSAVEQRPVSRPMEAFLLGQGSSAAQQVVMSQPLSGLH